MTINCADNEFGNVELKDGRFVRLTQQAYADNNSHGEAAWFASGYLSTDIEDDETGPTVKVQWESLGNENAEDDANWDAPVSATHYAIGDLDLA